MGPAICYTYQAAAPPVAFAQAAASCKAMKPGTSSLASIAATDEEMFISKKILAEVKVPSQSVWIGAKRQTGGPWKWTSGALWRFTKFNAGQPKTGDCLVIDHVPAVP